VCYFIICKFIIFFIHYFKIILYYLNISFYSPALFKCNQPIIVLTIDTAALFICENLDSSFYWLAKLKTITYKSALSTQGLCEATFKHFSKLLRLLKWCLSLRQCTQANLFQYFSNSNTSSNSCITA